jgi:hypothetical protein
MTSDKIRRFNRDTWWLATGFLSAVIFAALVLALQEYHPTKVNPAEEAVQAGRSMPGPDTFRGMAQKFEPAVKNLSLGSVAHGSNPPTDVAIAVRTAS